VSASVGIFARVISALTATSSISIRRRHHLYRYAAQPAERCDAVGFAYTSISDQASDRPRRG
jgi:hypothetical protein